MAGPVSNRMPLMPVINPPHPEVLARAMRLHRPAASLEGRTWLMQGMNR